jgi:hypothetical protein
MGTTITFVSLLVGLITGTHAVELAPGPDVAAIEIRLNGTSRARLTRPPWRASIDFGEDLRPHRLTAIAFSDAGNAVATAEQWVNVAHDEAQVTLIPLAGPGDRVDAVRVSWACTGCGAPTSVEVTFDGTPLVLSDPKRVLLPLARGRDAHIVQANVTFAGGISAGAELVVGANTAASDVEVTAVPVEFSGEPLDDPAKLAGMLRAGGRPLEVVALEGGPARIVFVRDPAIPLPPWRWGNWKSHAHSGVLSMSQLPPGSAIRLLDPRPSSVDRSSVAVFDISRPFADRMESALTLLMAKAPVSAARSPALVEAVAIAGQHAARENRRRAVVLLSAAGPDRSAHSPESAARYLAQLGVPLQVWTIDKPSEDWPVTGPADSLTQLKRRWSELLERVENQRVAWVKGRYLPGEITVEDASQRVKLAGR